MHSFDAHHHHHHHHHDQSSYFIRDIINRQADTPIFHYSDLIGEPRDLTGKKKQICCVTLMIGCLLLPIFFVVALILLTMCPIDGDKIYASASLVKADDDYYNNTTLFAFNVHIELKASEGETRYGNTTVFLRHPNGTDIDWFPIAGARLAIGETRHVDVQLRMVSRRRLFNGSDPVVSGGGGGVLRLQTHVRFSGEVWMYRARPIAEVNCDLSVDVESRTLAYSECKHKVSCKA